MLKHRLALVTNIPAPYRLDLFRRLALHPGLDTKIFFLEKAGLRDQCLTNSELDFPHVFVVGPAVRNPVHNGRLHFCVGLVPSLAAFRPDSIIVGGASLAAWLCLLYARLRQVPVYVWWAGTHLSEQRRGPVSGVSRKILFKRAKGFFTYSSECDRYLAEIFRVQAESLHRLGNNTLDVTRFGAYAAALRMGRDDLAKPFNVLVAARLIPRKNVHTAIRAFSLFCCRYNGLAMLTIAGAGQDSLMLQNICRKEGLENVHFLGEVPAAKMSEVYAMADVLISIAIMDQWPQVVNEAMACGVPVIVSNTSGIDSGVVRNGINGFVVEPTDAGAIARHLLEMAVDRKRCVAMGRASRETVLEYGVDRVIDSIYHTLVYD